MHPLGKGHQFKDLTGMRFGKLLVIKQGKHKEIGVKKIVKKITYDCLCDCGNIHNTLGEALKSNGVTMCNTCSRIKLSKGVNTTHGMGNTRDYSIWCDIKKRCNNIKCKQYFRYGGRGIKVCDCITDFETFYNHISNLPNYGVDGYSLDRKNNNGNYCICTNNLRWVTQSEQMRNTRYKGGFSGIRGVTTNNNGNTWKSRITVSGKHVYLGSYKNKEDAVKVRKDAELKYWGYNI